MPLGVDSSRNTATGGAPSALTGIVPRWEWRLIAHSLPVDSARLTMLPGGAVLSSETYLLSALSPHNVKVRGGLLEIKRLHERSPDGLEQWRPTARAPFPLDAPTRAELWGAWGIDAPSGVAAMPSLADLIREVVSPRPLLARVDLVKRRFRVSLAGCNGELVELGVAGANWISLAFEDANPGLVRAALAAAGLDPAANLNYPAALKRIVGLPSVVAEKEGVP